MSLHLPISTSSSYAIPSKALRRWSSERLRSEKRDDGGVVYCFTLSGSTCNNMGRAIEVEMIVTVGADGRIESASARSAAGDSGCDAMCASEGNGARFLAAVGSCGEAIGLTLAEAAFRDWREEMSGCFCSEANRRHKWRNAFQTMHFAATLSSP
jgi:hypothetical protein